MNAETIADLQRQLAAIERKLARHRTGVVTATGPLTVAVGGAAETYTDVKQLDGTVLAIDDVVSVLMFGNDALVLGRIA